MQIRLFSCLTVAVGCFVLNIDQMAAQGGPPLITEDPGTPGTGNWEINAAVVAEATEDERLFEAPLLDINYGLGERIQLKYEIWWTTLDEDGKDVISGLGNSEVGVKYRFLDYEEHGLSMSVYPQYEFHNPTSSDERGLVDDPVLLLPLQMARPIGPFEVTVEVGRAVVESSIDEWFYGTAAAYPLTERLELLGEFHVISTRGFENHEFILNAGGEYSIDQHMNLLFSAGRSFAAGDIEDREFLAYLGLQLLY